MSGVNHEGRGTLVGFPSEKWRHSSSCAYVQHDKTCTCSAGTWQEEVNGHKHTEMPASDEMRGRIADQLVPRGWGQPNPAPTKEELLKKAEELPQIRQGSHGDFAKTALIANELQRIFRSAMMPAQLPATQQHAAEMILVKLARVASGDNNHLDHWLDIAGYAALVAKDLK